MTYIQYETTRFQKKTQLVIDQANEIITSYQLQGYLLTLRQLYYQFVARDLIANNSASYEKLGVTINKARLAGLVDWTAIVDRTRNLMTYDVWDDAGDALTDCAHLFSIDKWLDQPKYVEVWIEKDALVGVIEGPCNELQVPYFASRGYNSQSEMWRAGERYREIENDGREVVIIHLGDHDPSGIDMTRDMSSRLNMFAGRDVTMERIALNMDQVRLYEPPPNPAKLTDTRARDYVKRYGNQSWELDALEPTVISELTRQTILKHCDPEKWQASKERENEMRASLKKLIPEV